MRVYVEGGGDTTAQAKPLRIAVKQWIEAAVEGGSRVTVVACGDRREAYESFVRAVAAHRDAFCILLVDSEEPVAPGPRWAHVKHRRGDGWEPPAGITDENLHFMAQTMEAWLCADPEALGAWFGADFKAASLPARPDLEQEPKADLNQKLAAATRGSKRGAYRKGRDLGLLGSVSPQKVIVRCRHAGIFRDVLADRLRA